MIMSFSCQGSVEKRRGILGSLRRLMDHSLWIWGALKIVNVVPNLFHTMNVSARAHMHCAVPVVCSVPCVPYFSRRNRSIPFRPVPDFSNHSLSHKGPE